MALRKILMDNQMIMFYILYKTLPLQSRIFPAQNPEIS